MVVYQKYVNQDSVWCGLLAVQNYESSLYELSQPALPSG